MSFTHCFYPCFKALSERRERLAERLVRFDSVLYHFADVTGGFFLARIFKLIRKQFVFFLVVFIMMDPVFHPDPGLVEIIHRRSPWVASILK
ncbi:hypothetical protein TRIP_B330455 [uncultured Desulfatiglans sp.]|nr:hypothetical protein TRIP_B330455 [uncultured Desulfatiglans sp.]